MGTFDSRHDKSIRTVIALLTEAHGALLTCAPSAEAARKDPRVRELESALRDALKLAEAAR